MIKTIKSILNKILCFFRPEKEKNEMNFIITKPTTQLLNDPTTPALKIVKKIVPVKFLNFSVLGFNKTGNALLSEGWQKENVYANINSTLGFFKKYFPANVKKWAATNNLVVNTRAGNDANAYYDRRGLKFFYFNANKKIIYTCDSADVVTHELGHAILDSIRPDFWNIAAFEIGAFHESFGDMIALLTILNYDVCLNQLLQNTNNDLEKSNFASQLAEQFGVSLKIGNCLRNALNNYNYVEPETLPYDGNGLIQEIHSFSQVWTGTFYEILVEFFNLFGKNYNALVQARDLSAEFLFNAAANTPANNKFFMALANNYIAYDLSKYSSQYTSILTKVFLKRNLISASLAESLTNKKFNILSDNNNVLVKEEKFTSLSCSEFNLNGNEFNVQIAADSYKPANGVFNALSVVENYDDSLNAAKSFVKYLKSKDNIGEKPNQSWEIDKKSNNLVRKFSCCSDLGFINNCTIEGQPEYGKCWKPDNNSGCCPYGCPKTPEPIVPLKQECSISYNSCNSNSYNNCNGTIYSVCNCRKR